MYQTYKFKPVVFSCLKRLNRQDAFVPCPYILETNGHFCAEMGSPLDKFNVMFIQQV